MKHIQSMLFFYPISLYAMQLDTSQPKSLKTLAADVLVKYAVADPKCLKSTKMIPEIKDKIARRWSARYSSKVPFFVRKLEVDTIALDENYFNYNDHAHFSFYYNYADDEIIVYDALSGGLVKNIPVPMTDIKKTLFSITGDCLAVQRRSGLLTIHDFRQSSEINWEFDHPSQIRIVELEGSKNYLLWHNRHDHIYVFNTLQPWAKKYCFSVPTYHEFVGSGKSDIIINDCNANALRFFDIDTGVLKRTISTEAPLCNVTLSQDNLLLCANQDLHKESTFFYSLQEDRVETLDSYHAPSLVTGKNFFCKHFNHVLSLSEKKKPHSRFYCAPLDIVSENFVPQQECLDHNFMLLLGKHNELLICMAKKPQTFDELMLRLVAAQIIKKKGASLDEINEVRSHFTRVKDSMTREIVMSVLASHYPGTFLH